MLGYNKALVTDEKWWELFFQQVSVLSSLRICTNPDWLYQVVGLTSSPLFSSLQQECLIPIINCFAAELKVLIQELDIKPQKIQLEKLTQYFEKVKI